MLSQPLGLCFGQARAAEYVLTYKPAPLHELFDIVELVRRSAIPPPLRELTRQRDNKAQPILEVHSLGPVKQPWPVEVGMLVGDPGQRFGNARLKRVPR